MSSDQPPELSSMQVTLQILSIVFYTFIAFICIGLPIAVLPGYVHGHLGFGTIVTGLVISIQYLATLISRPTAGRLTDSLGTKRSITYGLYGITLSGVLTLLSTLLESWPALSIALLLCGRVALGLAQGLIGVGTNSWGITRFGATNTAKVISWNGIASYGAIAIGAPLGVVMVGALSYHSLGIALSLLALGALATLRKRVSLPVTGGERLPFSAVFWQVAPHGLSLTLASIGYGTLTTFITLYYLDRGWEGAAYCLTVFGIAFVVARLLFVNAINRFGGYSVAICCMTVETLGLILLWIAPSTGYALVGASMAGFGLSLVYPAIGVEVIKRIPSHSRGAGLGAYSLFFDLALAISGPLMGAIATGLGYGWIFITAAGFAAVGLLLSGWLSTRNRPTVEL